MSKQRSAAAFRRSDKHILPVSQLEVELRKPDPSRIIMTAKKGEIPLPLKMKVVNSFNNAQKKAAGQEVAEEDFSFTVGEDDLEEFQYYMDSVVRAACIFPTIVKDHKPDYDAGEIDIQDLDPADFQYIYHFAMPEEATTAATFPEQQTSDVGLVPDGEELSAAPEPVS